MQNKTKYSLTDKDQYEYEQAIKGSNATTANVQASALTSKTSRGKASFDNTVSQTDTDVNNNTMQNKSD